jgi:hypothetical protein
MGTELEFVVKVISSKLLCPGMLPRMILRVPGVGVDPVVYVKVTSSKVPGVIVEFDPTIELRSVEPASKLIIYAVPEPTPSSRLPTSTDSVYVVSGNSETPKTWDIEPPLLNAAVLPSGTEVK